ncbi:MAG: adenylate/guanylate cyclase domain-containing protein [Geitlerinemataceae cyanobacterium]
MSNPSLNRIVSKIVRKVSLRSTVTNLLPVLPVLAVLGLAGYLYWSLSQQSVKHVATDLQQEIVARIEQYLESELAISERIASNNADTSALGLLGVEDLSRWEPHLKQQMQHADSLEKIAIANVEGELIRVQKLDRRVSVQTKDRQGTTTGRSNPPSALPSWYAAAIEAGHPIWSETPVEGTPSQRSLSIAQPLYNPQGNLSGVVACFLSLREIDSFLQTLNLGGAGRAFIVDRSGYLVATSVIPESGESADPNLLAVESLDVITQGSAQYLAQNIEASLPILDPQQLEFQVNGQRQFLRVLPFYVDAGIDWSIVVVLPESNFVNPAKVKTRTIFLLGLVALPLVAMAGVYTRRQIPEFDKALDRSGVLSHRDVSLCDESQSSLILDSTEPFNNPFNEPFNDFGGGSIVPSLLPIPDRSTVLPPDSFSYEHRHLDRPVRLLVVDDTPGLLGTLTKYLSPQHYQISIASRSLEAFKIIEGNFQPDLILFDAQMSDLSGHEFCQKIRETFRFYELPIVILTDPTQDAETMEILNWGANDYLTKPVVKHELISRIRTQLHLAHLNAAYSRFIPKQFLQLLNKESILDVDVGDNILREMSVLFSDIRSFTTISETMTPEENFKFINSYLSRMEPAIMANNGFIDKFIGDSIMALFSGSADDAIKAAIMMLNTLVEYNQHRSKVKYPPVKIGIGINTGSLMLGTVGGINRMDGTVISDAVNLASRIESLTKEYGVSLLISHQTFAQLQNPSDYNMRLIDRLKVKGKSKAVAVFEVFDGDPPDLRKAKLATAGIFEQGVLYYHGNSFHKAADRFEDCLRQNPEDRVAQIYLDRCQMQLDRVEN